MEWTDRDAADEARRGNSHGFRVLVERHSRALFRLAFRMSGNEQDAEDLVQETFLRAFKQIHRFDGRAEFGTWLHRICANCALDLLRARKSRKELAPRSDRDGSGDGGRWLNQIASPGPSPECLTQSTQIAGLLEPALAEMSEMERTAFVLRHYEGCGIEEIAEALGVQTSAAKHSVFRAVQKLRRALEPVWGATR